MLFIIILIRIKITLTIDLQSKHNILSIKYDYEKDMPPFFKIYLLKFCGFANYGR